MLKSKTYLIAAIGTGIGKTFLAQSICRILSEREIPVTAIKPVVSGFVDDGESDPAKILDALGLEVSQKNLDSIAPWRFSHPVAPHFAARMSGQKLDFLEIKKFCLEKISAAKSFDQYLFIEGAGGVMTPMTEEKNFLDLAAELEIPVLLLTANYLGSISHTLCAIEALKNKKLVIEKVIMNEMHPSEEQSSLADIYQVMETIHSFSKTPTVSLQNFLQNLLD